MLYRNSRKRLPKLEYQHLEMIVEVMPELTIDSAIFNTDGLANDVVIINDAIVFRFPLYDWVREDMNHEAACLRLASEVSPIPVPKWTIHRGEFISYQKLHGEELTWDQLMRYDDCGKDSAADQLAGFLKGLHSISLEQMRTEGIKTSMTMHTYDDWLQLYDDVQKDLYPYATIGTKDHIDSLFRRIIADNTFTDHIPAFINGDVASYHILADHHTQTIRGIIDFGTAGSGDPALDLASLILHYGEEFVGRIIRRYRELESLLNRARFIAQTYPLQWALGGIRTGDPAWYLVHLGTAPVTRQFGEPPAPGS